MTFLKMLRPIPTVFIPLMLIFLLQPALGTQTEIHPLSNSKESRISLQFNQIELTELLQVLAKMGKTNFLLSASIEGKISVDLQDIPWQTALHSILASRGLEIIQTKTQAPI